GRPRADTGQSTRSSKQRTRGPSLPARRAGPGGSSGPPGRRDYTLRPPAGEGQVRGGAPAGNWPCTGGRHRLPCAAEEVPMPTTPPAPQALAAWLEVLDQIDQALDRSLALAAEPPAAPETPGLAGQAAAAALGSLDDRLGRIEAGLARAGEQAALAD